MTNEVLNDAEDWVLLNPAQNRENYIYAVVPSYAFKKRAFETTISSQLEKEVDAFKGRHWSLDEAGQEIKGSSTFLGLRFDKAIRHQGLWVPGVQEARALDDAKKLTNGVYRDFGLVVYSEAQPNEDIAKALAEKAIALGIESPLLVPFKSLDYRINPKSPYGVDISFVDNPQGIVNGNDARDILAKFNWKGNSGALRVYRDDYGDWYADWYSLAGSYDYGWVGDWICGEAARADLANAYASLSERKYGAKIKELQKQMQTEKDAFTKVLEASQ